MLFVVLSSLFYVVSFPVTAFWYFSFVALIPLFYSLERASSHTLRFVYGFFWGSGISFGLGYFVLFALLNHYEKPFGTSLLFFVLCVMLPIGIIYGVFALLYGKLYQDNFFFHLIVIPSGWVVTDYIKEIIPLLIPWGNIGYTQLEFSEFIQIADITGIHGVSFLIVLINCAGYLLLRNKIFQGHPFSAHLFKKQLGLVLCIALCILVPFCYGKYRLSAFQTFEQTFEPAFEQAKADKINTVLVQGNFSLKERWSGKGFYSRLESYLEESKCSKPSDLCLIVWPETVLNPSSKVNRKLFKEIVNAIHPNSMIIAGGIRKQNNAGGVFNSAFFISGQGKITWYDKNILLPYGELSPFGDILGSYLNAPAKFNIGQTSPSVSTEFGNIGISICLEGLYPDYFRKATQKGAVFFVNISNDAWFGKTSMPYLQLAANRFRAIENRRYLLRVSNNGISAIIAPDGKILSKTGLFTTETKKGTILKKYDKSIYTILGNWVVWLAILVFLAAMTKRFFKPLEREV